MLGIVGIEAFWHYFSGMRLELTDEEAAALLRLLNRAVEDDRYPLSPRIRTLRHIRAKLRCPTRTAASETAAHRPNPGVRGTI